MAKRIFRSTDRKRPDKPDVKSSNGTSRVSHETGRISMIEIDRYQIFFPAILILVGALIYANTLNAPFVADDLIAITENDLVRMEEISPKSIFDAATGFGKNRPVPMLSFGLNYYFGRYNVGGYHLVNIIIHITNGILLFFLVKLTLMLVSRQNMDESKCDPKAINLLSFFTSLVWLSNPVQTQSVTYIVQRMTSVGAMFYLLAIILYARGRIAQLAYYQKGKSGPKQFYFWFAGCLVSGLLALGSKENTAMLPIFIFLYEWYFFRGLDGKWFKRQIKYLAALAILFGFIAGLYLGFDPLGIINTLRDYSLGEFTIGERLLTQTRVVLFYLGQIFYPNPSRLNLDHDFPLSYSLFNPPATLLSSIIIIALIGLGFLLAKKHRLISFCIFWYFGNLVIESSVIPLALIFEHRIYLPSMFVFAAIVVLAHRWLKPAWLATAIACAVVVLFAYWTYERNKIWQDDVALWFDCIKKSPNKARPYFNLAQVLANKKRYDEALPNFLTAVKINPALFDAQYNLGILYEKRGAPNKAIRHYRKAIELKPESEKANNNLGVVLLNQNSIDEAVVHFRKVLNKNPDNATAHTNLGMALSKQDKVDEAAAHFHTALQINPDLSQAHFQLGATLLKRGRTPQGVHHIQRALEIDPEFAEAHNNLGGHLLQEGKNDEALKHFNAALKIEPEIAEAHNNVGIILAHRGNISEAVFHFQEAVRLKPDFELAKDNLHRAIAIQQSNQESEIDRIQSELDANPDDPILYYILGNLYLGKGDLNRATAGFDKATELQPDFLQALNNLAMAHTVAGQHDRALEVFQKLIALQPDNAANHYNVGVLYALQGKKAAALEWLKKAVDKGYDNWALIKTDKDLASIRDTEGYKELVAGH